MARLAWFSPMPPVPSGPALDSAVLVRTLGATHEIDVFVDEPIAAALRGRAVPGARDVRSAHDFIWRQRLNPYDLAVYQLGHSSAHDYLWPYLFKFPGLTVLHDAHLHHARAASLLRQARTSDYRAEFAAAHAGVSPDLAELAVFGFDTHLLYSWPMTSLVVRASRVTVVHASSLVADLRAAAPNATVESIRLGHGEKIDEGREAAARRHVRAQHGIAEDAVVFGLFGGLSPEKRVAQVLNAFDAVLEYHPGARLLLVGAAAAHYDVSADIAARHLGSRAILAGRVDDDAFTDHLAACDVVVNLRWPTAREVSGPWLRSLAAGRATIATDLSHMANVPALDPRTWTVPSTTAGGGADIDPVTVAIDILDEEHSLRLAMRKLAADGDLRARLGRAAVKYWESEHAPERMVTDYERVIARAIDTPDPRPELPAHLVADGLEQLRALTQRFGVHPFSFQLPAEN